MTQRVVADPTPPPPPPPSQGATLIDLLPALVSIANTMGLVIIVLLLGYGAAEVPRSLLRRANPAAELRRLYFKAPETDGALFDAKQELGDTLTDIAKFAAKVELMSRDKDFASGGNRDKLVQLQRALEVVNRKVGYAHSVLGKSYGARRGLRRKRSGERAARPPLSPPSPLLVCRRDGCIAPGRDRAHVC